VTTWSLQEAKNHFSVLVEAARRGQAQRVTRHGKPAVVVVAVEDYERLVARAADEELTLTAHLLAMPADDNEFERLAVAPREWVP
jgi:prevent-host-death family protein